MACFEMLLLFVIHKIPEVALNSSKNVRVERQAKRTLCFEEAIKHIYL